MLHERAMDNLRFIRETMERATAFTAVPGWGLVAIGVTALCAAGVASLQATARAWLLVWALEASAAVMIAGWTMRRKARRAAGPLFSTPGRKFALSFCPPVLAGAVLTVVLARSGTLGVLPGVWLLSYGAAVVAAGAFSVSIVPVMGLCFMTIGCVALLGPASWEAPLLALGFGGLHLVFGAIIARNYGG